MVDFTQILYLQFYSKYIRKNDDVLVEVHSDELLWGSLDKDDDGRNKQSDELEEMKISLC